MQRIEPQYRPFILREYNYWTLLLNERQRYLGRAVLWLARPGNMQRFSLLSHEELSELQLITQEYERALEAVGWMPDHMNYAMLGNFFHEHNGHGHMHLIPRYAPRKSPLTFMGVTFNDDRWGQNYTPETPMRVSPVILDAIVAVLRVNLEKVLS
jgi:diadenosine tetraphosphate (Ap4A) HIT family hydrolase